MTDEYMEESLHPAVPGTGKEFSVSNITIRKALETLTQDGLLRRKKEASGRLYRNVNGTSLSSSLPVIFRRLVRSIEDLPVELEVLEIKVIPCPHYVRKMLCSRS